MKISGEFMAIGNERYITIGNYNVDSTTDTSLFNPSFLGTTNQSYYYIEDVSVVCCDCVQEEISLPNAFSPNGDGHNDVFRILGDANKVDLRIFNRWGEEVFYTNEISVGWNGTYKGNELNNGVFFYILNAVTKSGIEVELKGNVTLLK
jgi:gliding motility-associated-like protein